MPSVSPIAEYLRINKAIPKRDKFGCHFVSPEGLYLGRLTKSIVNNYKVISLDIFGEGLKKMFTKSVAFGQQYIYVKNPAAPIGVSITPNITYMRKVFVDFTQGTNTIEDSEKSLSNKLDLIAYDDLTGVGLYDIEKPFMYHTNIISNKFSKLRRPKFKFSSN